MDIPTHGLMAAVIAGGAFPERPALAACFVVGAMSPDLDLLLRAHGPVTFLRLHQTVTHSLPTIAFIAAIPGLIALALAPGCAVYFPVFAGGMLFHSVLDATNTFGLQALAPLTRKRYCTEWLFCVDAFVTASTCVALGARRMLGNASAPTIAVGYAVLMAAYWVLRAGLRRRAATLAPPDTVSLIPTSLWPWIFLGCARTGGKVRTFELNVADGSLRGACDWEILDGKYRENLSSLPEFRAMRALSPLYHAVVEADAGDGTRVTCRDLRIRNLRTHFGELVVDIGPTGQTKVVRFRV